MTRYEKLLNRRTDPEVSKFTAFSANEAYKAVQEGENIKYALGAMQPVDPEYTKNTYSECERVQNQLAKAFDAADISVDFDHQGSVTNDTHIKARSDIDLLTVVQRFHWVELPNRPTIPYTGDAVADLRAARKTAITTLQSKFPEATVTPGNKSVKISDGSLRREVDVVSCAWWHTVEYRQTSDRKWLGIGILDNPTGEEIKNKPFLHNDRIEARDKAKRGHIRRIARLLKSLRNDSEGRVNLSSYDIVGIAYNIYDHLVDSVAEGHELPLLEKTDQWLNVLEYSEGVRIEIEVPNKTRKVFCTGGATLQELRALRKELNDLMSSIKIELASSHHSLEEVIIPDFPRTRPIVLEPVYRMHF